MMLSRSGMGGMIFLAILAAQMATVMIACGEETFINTNLPYAIGNNTMLVVEDADPRTGMIWAQIFNRSDLTWSGVLRVGESYNGSRGSNFTVTDVYAGGDGYLVGLRLEGKIGDTSPVHSIPLNGSSAAKQRPEMTAAQALPVVALLGLAIRRRPS
ncbi:MAG TPA: hypothetical protein VN455_04915 [Methanotrichaceae archaeon]|nr:hypothetical protein [Methanotrichaceae archaeon]